MINYFFSINLNFFLTPKMSTNKKIFYGLFGTALVAGGVTSALWVTGTWPFNGGSKLTMKSTKIDQLDLKEAFSVYTASGKSNLHLTIEEFRLSVFVLNLFASLDKNKLLGGLDKCFKEGSSEELTKAQTSSFEKKIDNVVQQGEKIIKELFKETDKVKREDYIKKSDYFYKFKFDKVGEKQILVVDDSQKKRCGDVALWYSYLKDTFSSRTDKDLLDAAMKEEYEDNQKKKYSFIIIAFAIYSELVDLPLDSSDLD